MATHRQETVFGAIYAEPALIVARFPAIPIFSSSDWTYLRWTIILRSNKLLRRLTWRKSIAVAVACLICNCYPQTLSRGPDATPFHEFLQAYCAAIASPLPVAAKKTCPRCYLRVATSSGIKPMGWSHIFVLRKGRAISYTSYRPKWRVVLGQQIPGPSLPETSWPRPDYWHFHRFALTGNAAAQQNVSFPEVMDSAIVTQHWPLAYCGRLGLLPCWWWIPLPGAFFELR